MENPAEMTKLREYPDLLPRAIEEMLRWVSPVKHFFRTATEDCEIRGRKIRAGDSLMICFPSGNRDEAVFHEPFVFNVERRPNSHIAFGHGVHLCIGLHLARMEMTALFRELLSRLDDFKLAGAPALLASHTIIGLKTLPISFAVKR